MAGTKRKIIKVLLVDNHQLVREGIRALIEKQSDIQVVGEVADSRDAVELARKLKPSVVVMDIAFPSVNEIESMRQIVEEIQGTKVVALSTYDQPQAVMEALRAGASGYLLKGCAKEELVQAVRLVNADLAFLSPELADSMLSDYVTRRNEKASCSSTTLSARERQVLKLLAEGNSTKQIASNLEVSVKTVETYRRKIMQKLNLQNIAALTKYAIRVGLTSADS